MWKFDEFVCKRCPITQLLSWPSFIKQWIVKMISKPYLKFKGGGEKKNH